MKTYNAQILETERILEVKQKMDLTYENYKVDIESHKVDIESHKRRFKKVEASQLHIIKTLK